MSTEEKEESGGKKSEKRVFIFILIFHKSRKIYIFNITNFRLWQKSPQTTGCKTELRLLYYKKKQ